MTFSLVGCGMHDIFALDAERFDVPSDDGCIFCREIDNQDAEEMGFFVDRGLARQFGDLGIGVLEAGLNDLPRRFPMAAGIVGPNVLFHQQVNHG